MIDLSFFKCISFQFQDWPKEQLVNELHRVDVILSLTSVYGPNVDELSLRSDRICDELKWRELENAQMVHTGFLQ